MKKIVIDAYKLRIGLGVLLALIVIGSFLIFLLGYGKIKEVSEDVNQRQIQSTASEDALSSMGRLEVALEQESATIAALQNIAPARSSLLQFNTENSLRHLADRIGIKIENVSFVSQSGATDNQSGTAKPASKSTNNSRVSFSISGSIAYSDLLRFLNAIETSSPKLRIEGINVSAGSPSSSQVSVGAITMELSL